MTHAAASAYANSLSLYRLADWRLRTKTEAAMMCSHRPYLRSQRHLRLLDSDAVCLHLAIPQLRSANRIFLLPKPQHNTAHTPSSENKQLVMPHCSALKSAGQPRLFRKNFLSLHRRSIGTYTNTPTPLISMPDTDASLSIGKAVLGHRHQCRTGQHPKSFRRPTTQQVVTERCRTTPRPLPYGTHITSRTA
ncbi:MAG: hypothetical protein IJV22_00185 [Bacteroidales bacterium]|nr:hypothetical protein [Bacteroidales bacterium]